MWSRRSVKSGKSYNTTFSSPPISMTTTDAIKDPNHSRIRLPCEYARLGLCNETFGPDETDFWQWHILTLHLQDNPPPHCICWFCDREFSSSKDHDGNVEENFRLRLEHIRDHIVHQERFQAEHMRPDYFLLEHMYRNGLLERVPYQLECNYTERPATSGIVGYNYTPPERRRAKELELPLEHNQSTSPADNATRFRQLRPSHPAEYKKPFWKQPVVYRKNYLLEPWNSKPLCRRAPVTDLGPPPWKEENHISEELWLLQLYGDVKKAATSSSLGWPAENIEAVGQADLRAITRHVYYSTGQVLGYLQQVHGQSWSADVHFYWEWLQARQR
ncbi:hypothetical protein PG993_004228 [Apiospora rasikravindrae]|uniref:Uncharacterized protein n=1 Tax=Apiospora rasikravindrae TaxID=990691 RepID=A0ABR1TC79_9PEZI